MSNPLAGSRFYARLGNALTRPLWSVFPAPSGFGVLTVVGRRSGKLRRTSVRAIRAGDAVYVVAMMAERSEWLKNIRADPRVGIRLGAATLRGSAHEVVDADAREQAAKVWVETTNANDYIDYVVYHWGIPSRRRIEHAHREWFDNGVPVVIELDEGEH